jgi:hypothetical protein
MWEHRDALRSLPPVTDRRLALEGIIWHAGWREQRERRTVPEHPSNTHHF